MHEDAWNGEEEDEAGDADEVEETSNGDDEETTPCPYCRRPMYEDSHRCPHCGNYLSEEDAASPRKPWWMIVGVALALYVVYRWIAG